MARKSMFTIVLQILMWVFLADAAIFALVSLGAFVHTSLFLRRAVTVQGKVTGLRKVEDADTGTTYAPVITFKTLDGKEYTAASNASSNPPGFEVGEEVLLRYDPRNPEAARIATFWQTWPFAAGFAIGSVVTGGVGVLFWKWVNRRLHAPAKLKKISSLDSI